MNEKYLKYKKKYFELQHGGNNELNTINEKLVKEYLNTLFKKPIHPSVKYGNYSTWYFPLNNNGRCYIADVSGGKRTSFYYSLDGTSFFGPKPFENLVDELSTLDKIWTW
jgi:hypothetical protein